MSARPHFRLLGVPVRIEPLFWIIAVFLGLGLEDPALIIVWVVVLVVSVLVHEFGHALALKVFGQSSSIVLHGFGGLTFSQRRLSRGQSILVSLAGPFSALFLLGIPAYLLRESDRGLQLYIDWRVDGGGFGWWPVIYFVAWVNTFWSFANLLPIRPLDGGNVLTEIVGIQTARLLSIVVGGAAAVWAYTHTVEFQMAAFFAAFLAFINFREYRAASQGVRAPSSFDIEAPTPSGGGGVRPGSAAASPPAASRPVRRSSGWPTEPPAPPMPTPIDPASAERLAWNLLRQGDVAGAAAAVRRAGPSADPFLRGAIALAQGQGVQQLAEAYADDPDGPSNLVVAAIADATGQLPALIEALASNDGAGLDALHSIQTHLHYGERFAAAAAVGERLHPVATARAQVAFDTAAAWARAGDDERAMHWLRQAVADGFGSVSLLDGEPDLAAVRERADWHEFRSTLN